MFFDNSESLNNVLVVILDYLSKKTFYFLNFKETNLIMSTKKQQPRNAENGQFVSAKCLDSNGSTQAVEKDSYEEFMQKCDDATQICLDSFPEGFFTSDIWDKIDEIALEIAARKSRQKGKLVDPLPETVMLSLASPFTVSIFHEPPSKMAIARGQAHGIPVNEITGKEKTIPRLEDCIPSSMAKEYHPLWAGDDYVNNPEFIEAAFITWYDDQVNNAGRGESFRNRLSTLCRAAIVENGHRRLTPREYAEQQASQ